MNEKVKTDTLKWVHSWKQAGAVLEKLRQAELEHVDVQKTIAYLNDAFESALVHSPPKSTSGLVEMQAWFLKARR
jgi:hypothetical protein